MRFQLHVYIMFDIDIIKKNISVVALTIDRRNDIRNNIGLTDQW